MLNYFLYRLGKFIVLSVPLKIGYKVAVFVADFKYFISGRDRKAVQSNLKVIFPDKPQKEINCLARRTFRNFGKYLVDFFRFIRLDQEYIKNNIKIENLHYYDEALQKGKGIIVLTAHIGNWELGGVVIALSGFPIWIVALPHKNKKVNDLFDSQRKSKGINIMALGHAARHCLTLLGENKIVALAGDREFGGKGILVNLFGKPTAFPLGPAVFALKTGSPIVPGFMLRNPDDTFTLRIEKPIEVVPESKDNKEERDKKISAVVESYKGIIEDYIRKYPDQWYVFRRFWEK